MARYKNPNDGPVSFTFMNGKDPVRVEGGKSVSTNDPEVETALRKAGFKEYSSSSSTSSSSKKEEN